MLEKTFEIIKDLKPGTYVAEDQACFDPAEMEALGRMLQRLNYAPSQLRKKLQEYNVTIVPANFYSEIPLIADIEKSFETRRTEDFDLIFRPEILKETLSHLTEFGHELVVPLEDDGSGRYFWNNTQFSYSDAMSYYCMIRHRKPKRIVEVGSGFSSLVASAAIQKNGFGEIVCIEPYPRAFLSDVPAVTNIIKVAAQELDARFFNEQMSEGDFLFIDSTHTVKHDSDCIHLYLRILPRIRKKIVVHAHDIFLPGTLSLKSMRDHQIYWTEQYLLYAYLLYNSRAVVRYSSAYNYIENRDGLDAMMHGKHGSGGGSLWFDHE